MIKQNVYFQLLSILILDIPISTVTHINLMFSAQGYKTLVFRFPHLFKPVVLKLRAIEYHKKMQK